MNRAVSVLRSHQPHRGEERADAARVAGQPMVAVPLAAKGSVVGSPHPAHAIGRDNDQTVLEIHLLAVGQQGQQHGSDILHRGRMRLHPDDAEMSGQRQDHPVAKMSIKRDERSFLAHGAFQNQRIIRAGLAGFRGTHHVLPASAQQFAEFRSQALVEVKTHVESSRCESSDFRVQNGVPGVIENGLDVGAGQFRVAAQNGIPRFVAGQLFQDGCDMDARALANGLTAADPRIDFDSSVDGMNLTRTA